MRQEVKFEIINNENVGWFTQEQLVKLNEIFKALVTSGGLTGVKGGKTIIHFDAGGNFMGVELDYWPWRKRKEGG